MGRRTQITVSPLTKDLWWGKVEDPKGLPFPNNLWGIIVGFEVVLWTYAVLLFIQSNVGTLQVPASTDRIFVRNCYLEAGCTSQFQFQSFNAKISQRNGGEILIDGSTSLRCQIVMCFEDRGNKPFAFYTSRTVLNLEKFGTSTNTSQGFYSIAHPLNVSSWDLYPGTTSKLLMDGLTGPQLNVNFTQGIVQLDRMDVTEMNVINAHGPVYIQNDLDPSFPDTNGAWSLNAVIQDGGYCVTPNVTSWSAPSCGLSGSNCDFFASNTKINGTGPVGKINTYNINATSIYIHDYVYGLSEEVFEYNGTRVGGPLMDTTPEVSGYLLDLLNSTETWAALSTIDDYVQAIEIVTPGLGTLYLNGKKRITMEIGPEWLAFLSAYALRVHYRRLSSPLNHYRCRDMIGTIEDRSSSLINLHQGSSFDYNAWEAEDFGDLIRNHFIFDDQYKVGLALHKAATPDGLLTSLTVFTSPEQEYTKVDDLLGNRWVFYYFAPQADGSLVLRKLTMSAVATALIVLSLSSAFFMVLALYTILVTQRYKILNSFMLQNQRELLRNAVDYKQRCPYHYFFSVMSMTTWITFRVGLYVVQNFKYPGRQQPFSRFLMYYFKKAVKEGKEDRIAESKISRLATEQVVTMYERWCLLRYRSNEMTSDDMESMLDGFGARRYTDTKLVLSGIRSKRGIKDTKFTLQYSSLQSFYDITRNSKDESLFDELYFRCVANSIHIDEDDLVKKCKQWKINVIRKPLEIVGNILNRNVAQLTEESMAPLVRLWEENAASYPSIAIVEYRTSGIEKVKRRRLVFFFWFLFEAISNFIAVFYPFIFAYVATLPLEIEHSRFSTSTSILLASEVATAATDTTAPRPQNLLSSTIFAATLFYTLSMMIEPFLVALTFRQVGMYQGNKFWHPKYLFLYLRFFLTGLSYFMLFCINTYIIVFMINVVVWWVLGAIIAPNRMLVYCSSILTFFYIMYSTYTNLESMRKGAMNKLKEEILNQILKMVRKTPAANLFDGAQDAADGIQAAADGGGAGKVTSGLVLDAISDSPDIREKAIANLSGALQTPASIIMLGLSLVKREPNLTKDAVSKVLAELKVPANFAPLATQLVFQLLNLPSSAAELSHALYKLHPEHEAKLLEYDEILVPLVQCALTKRYNEKVLVDAISRITLDEVSDMLKIPPLLMRRSFSMTWNLYKKQETAAMRDLVYVMDALEKHVPADPVAALSLWKVVTEGLKMVSYQDHNFNGAALDLMRKAGLRNNTLMRALMPLLQVGTANAADVYRDRKEVDFRAIRRRAFLSSKGVSERELTRMGTSGLENTDAFQKVLKDQADNALEAGEDAAEKVEEATETAGDVVDEADKRASEAMSALDDLDGEDDSDDYDEDDDDETKAKGELMKGFNTVEKQLMEAGSSVAQLVIQVAVLRFSMTQDQLTRLKNLFNLLLVETHDINKVIPVELQIRVPLNGVFKYAFRDMFDRVKTKELSQKELKEVLAANGNDPTTKKAKELFTKIEEAKTGLDDLKQRAEAGDIHLWLEFWFADNWLALDDFFRLKGAIRKPYCNTEVLSTHLGIPATGLNMLREAIQAGMTILRFAIPEVDDYREQADEWIEKGESKYRRHLEKLDEEKKKALEEKKNKKVDEAVVEVESKTQAELDKAEKEAHGKVKGKPGDLSGKLDIIECFAMLCEVADALTSEVDFTQCNIKLDPFIIAEIRRRATSTNFRMITEDAAENLKNKVRENAKARKEKLKKSFMSRYKNVDERRDVEDVLADAAAAATIAKDVTSLLMEFSVKDRKPSQSEILQIVKKIALFCYNKNIIDVKEIPFLDGAENYYQAIDDVFDLYSGNAFDFSGAAHVFNVDEKVFEAIRSPELLITKVREVSNLPTLMNIVKGKSIQDGAAATDSQLTSLLALLGVPSSDIRSAKAYLLFYSKEAAKLDEATLRAEKRMTEEVKGRMKNGVSAVIGQSLMQAEDLEEGEIENMKDFFLEEVQLRRTGNYMSLLSLLHQKEAVSHMKNRVRKPPGEIKDRLINKFTFGTDVAQKIMMDNMPPLILEIQDFVEDDRHPDLSKLDADDMAEIEEHLNGIALSDAMAMTRSFRDLDLTFAEVIEFSIHLPGMYMWLHNIIEDMENAESLPEHFAKKRADEFMTVLKPTMPKFHHRLQIYLEERKAEGRAKVAGLTDRVRKIEKSAAHDVRIRYAYDFASAFLMHPTVAKWNSWFQPAEMGTKMDFWDAFYRISPFYCLSTISSPVPVEVRELFGILSGTVAWFPARLPVRFCALCCAAIHHQNVSDSIIEVLSGSFPMRYRKLAVEIMQLSCGRSDGNLVAISEFVGLSPAILKTARDLLIPDSPEQLVGSLLTKRRVQLEHPSAVDMVKLYADLGVALPENYHFRWIIVLRECVRGNIVPLLLLDEFCDTEYEEQFSEIMFGCFASQAREALYLIYPNTDDNLVWPDDVDEEDIKGAVNQVDAKMKQFGTLYGKIKEFMPLPDEKNHMPLENDKLKVATVVRKVLDLIFGCMSVARSDFDAAGTHFSAFAGNDELMSLVARVGLLAVRLVMEEGAVADPSAIYRTLLALSKALPHLLPFEKMKDKHKHIAMLVAGVDDKMNITRIVADAKGLSKEEVVEVRGYVRPFIEEKLEEIIMNLVEEQAQNIVAGVEFDEDEEELFSAAQLATKHGGEMIKEIKDALEDGTKACQAIHGGLLLLKSVPDDPVGEIDSKLGGTCQPDSDDLLEYCKQRALECVDPTDPDFGKEAEVLMAEFDAQRNTSLVQIQGYITALVGDVWDKNKDAQMQAAISGARPGTGTGKRLVSDAQNLASEAEAAAAGAEAKVKSTEKVLDGHIGKLWNLCKSLTATAENVDNLDASGVHKAANQAAAGLISKRGHILEALTFFGDDIFGIVSAIKDMPDYTHLTDLTNMADKCCDMLNDFEDKICLYDERMKVPSGDKGETVKKIKSGFQTIVANIKTKRLQELMTSLHKMCLNHKTGLKYWKRFRAKEAAQSAVDLQSEYSQGAGKLKSGVMQFSEFDEQLILELIQDLHENHMDLIIKTLDDYVNYLENDDIEDEIQIQIRVCVRFSAQFKDVRKGLRMMKSVRKELPYLQQFVSQAKQINGLRDVVEETKGLLDEPAIDTTKNVIAVALRVVAPEDKQDVVPHAVNLFNAFIDAASDVMTTPSLDRVLIAAITIFSRIIDVHKALEQPTGADAKQIAEVEKKTKEVGDKVKELEETLEMAKGLHELVKKVLINTREDQVTSGAELFISLLNEMVQSKSVAIKAKAESEVKGHAVAAADAKLPLTQQDHRKLGLLLKVVKGNWDALPELVTSTGITIPEASLAQLLSVLKLMQSLRKIAKGKDLSNITVTDTIDIITSQIFNEFDIEKQGRITYDQYLTALKRMKLSLSASEAKLLFGKADVDESGYIDLDEFKGIIQDVQTRFQRQLVDTLNLSKEAIYITLIFTGISIAFLLAFIIMGVYAFSDGTQFTAVITGMLPAAGSVMSSIGDPNSMTFLLQACVEAVEMFFDRLNEISGR